jgi:hypothetical protein
MKRNLGLMTLSAAALLLFASCRKNYTCACTSVTTITTTDYYEENGKQKEDVETSTPVNMTYEVSTGKQTKRNAEKRCEEAGGVTESSVGSVMTVDGFKEGIVQKSSVDASCQLK